MIDQGEDELANRRRLASMGRDGSAPVSTALGRVVKTSGAVLPSARSTCVGCGVIIETIRVVEVECQSCEGKRNRSAHDKLTAAIREFKQRFGSGDRSEQDAWLRVIELGGRPYADGLRTALGSKASAAPKRSNREDY